MTPVNYIRIKSSTGTIRAVLTGAGSGSGQNGFSYLTWKNRVNAIDIAEFELNQDNPDTQYLVDKAQVEIIRADPANGLSEYTAFNGLIRYIEPFTDNNNRHRIKVRAYGLNHLLAQRRIAYDADVANFTVFIATSAETIQKRLVRYNFDPAYATVANGRDRTPNTLNVTIEADLARGAVLDWTCGGRTSVLTELQKIALVAGGDFNTVQTGANTYEFRFYLGQLGTDRTTGTNKVVFSLENGNMRTPRRPMDYSNVGTVAIVGGRGEGAARTIAVRTGPDYSATNDIEIYVDGRNADTAALNTLGDAALEESRFRNVIQYDVIQTSSYSIGKHYFLGDIVLAQYGGTSITQQVYETTFAYRDSREDVDVVMRDI